MSRKNSKCVFNEEIDFEELDILGVDSKIKSSLKRTVKKLKNKTKLNRNTQKDQFPSLEADCM